MPVSMSLAPTYSPTDHAVADGVTPLQPATAQPLSSLAPGSRGRITLVGVPEDHRPDAIAADELERRLLEIGFVEGATVEVLHEGLFGRDPIAVRVDDMRVALRRNEARGILVQPTITPHRRSGRGRGA